MFSGKKTYLVSLGAIFGAVGGFLTGTVSMPDAIQMIITAVLAATLRNGMPKV